MDKEWIPVISTLIGVLIGGGITTVAKLLELQFQKKKEIRNQIVNKHEELHELIIKLSDFIYIYCLEVKKIKHSGATHSSETLEFEKPLKELRPKLLTMAAFYCIKNENIN